MNMKVQVGNRIKSARLLSGLSLRELANDLNGIVSHNAISKYEKGQMLPDSKVLIALSKALNVKTDYFLRPNTVEISKIEFRKKSSLTVRKTNSIKENIKDHIERYLELETYLNVENSFENPIIDVFIDGPDDIENAVEKLLHKWDLGINALPNVIEILEEKDIKVIEVDADEKFDGLSGWANQDIPVIVINRNSTVERKRFTALHELGHLLLELNNPKFNHQDIERFCHQFAGAMLLPKESLMNELGEKRSSISINELIYIKESYGISIQAIMARAKGLGIISNDQYVKFRIWVNSNENYKKEIGLGEYKGVEHSSRFKKLIYRATAEEIISMSKAASLSNVKLAQFRDEFLAI
jgi:Zn-dependent peptidase ImmA (M78 family)/DNA-binding XRE family transcriptional regulator